jgi:hypothetical protein
VDTGEEVEGSLEVGCGEGGVDVERLTATGRVEARDERSSDGKGPEACESSDGSEGSAEWDEA